MSSFKLIQVKIPEPLYEEFYRLYPGRGELSTVVRELLQVAIDVAEEKNSFRDYIKQVVKETYGEID